MLELEPFEFARHWVLRQGPRKTGKATYPSYVYGGGYGDGYIPAIIKGIWTTRVDKAITVEEVIEEVSYLTTWEDDDDDVPKLLAFVIDKSPGLTEQPDCLIILEDKNYLSQQDLKTGLAKAAWRVLRKRLGNLRTTARRALKRKYSPEAVLKL